MRVRPKHPQQIPAKTPTSKPASKGKWGFGRKVVYAVGTAAVLGILLKTAYEWWQAPPQSSIALQGIHVHPGFQVVGDGGCLYYHDDITKILSGSECTTQFKEMKWSAHKAGYDSAIYTQENFDKKGCELVDTLTNQHFILGMNAKIRTCYEKALGLIQKWMKQPGFFQRTTEDIINVWKNIHRIMLGEISPNSAGKFRTECLVVFHDHELHGRTADQLHIDQMREAGATELEITEAMQAVKTTHSWCHLSESVKKTWSKIATFVPHPSEVPSLMHAMVDRLKEMIFRKEDPVSIAGFTHRELVRIHPWNDGNGRFARGMMNNFLDDPVVFLCDEIYSRAVLQDAKGERSFVEYLRDEAIPWCKRAYAKLTR